MGREIKRVALDFDWPHGEVWTGYLNPHYGEQVDCPKCEGTGSSRAGRLLGCLWYRHLHDEAMVILRTNLGFPAKMVVWANRILVSGRGWNKQLDQKDVNALIEGNRLWDFTRVPRTPEQVEIVKQKMADGGNSWLPTDNGYIPTADEVNAWSRHGFGHDSINSWICVKARAKRYGVEARCDACDGNGHVSNPELEARIEAWEQTEPPSGDGWQVWETVSEGSPVSPVFASADGLVEWLISEGYSLEAASKFVEHGWVMSALSVNGKFYKNIEMAETFA